MAFLGRKNRSDYKLVGVSLPPHIHEYLSLYALAKGLSKSTILKEKIENFISLQKMKQSDDDLLFDILQKIKVQWKAKRISEGVSFIAFKTDLEKELIMKGINKTHIKTLLEELDE